MQGFDEHLVEQMRNLSALNYTPEAIKAFLGQYSLQTILRTFLTTDLSRRADSYVITTTVNQLLNDSDTFRIVISDGELKDIVECFLKHENKVYREMLAEAILKNVGTTIEIFELFKETVDNSVIQGYINILYFLLRDPETSVGLKISKFFEKVSIN